MTRFLSLYSSSSGNSILISNSSTNILIDAGVSASKIVASLNEVGLGAQDIDAIFVTHEHSDHISGIRVLSKKYNIPVYANAPSMEGVLKNAPQIPPGSANIISASNVYEINSMKVKPFIIPHDSAAAFGYVIESEGKKYAVATDTGCITKAMLSNLAGCEAVIIEANHDVKMLNCGTYPYHLKRRILSDKGHLSNDKCAWLATQLAIWGTKRILLGHLSRENNTPQKAFECVNKCLEENGFKVGTDVLLKVAQPDEITYI
ncbi:MAG: MBL fold metallo-hydrolase [Clostridia bacterium]|nr:MBL fold metallo-hydrolase [Clostridia bacterium]MBO7289207.1 MBL fold metallo-hydrolase [Clostridia bacterium]